MLIYVNICLYCTRNCTGLVCRCDHCQLSCLILAACDNIIMIILLARPTLSELHPAAEGRVHLPLMMPVLSCLFTS